MSARFSVPYANNERNVSRYRCWIRAEYTSVRRNFRYSLRPVRFFFKINKAFIVLKILHLYVNSSLLIFCEIFLFINSWTAITY